MVTPAHLVKARVTIGSADTNWVDNHVTVLNTVTNTVVVATKLSGVNVSGDLSAHRLTPCFYWGISY